MDIPDCDAVITWVDGADPEHAEKLNYFISKKTECFYQESISSTRFSAVGELEYCVASILTFAPWIRTIFIVTDGQRPKFLNRLKGTALESKVVVVCHENIFPKTVDCLPTFNSLSIESVLWRIEGLSERFIYFNDDCILIRPVYFEDFFYRGQVVIRGQWRKQRSASDFFRSVQQHTAKLLGYRQFFFELKHIPAALTVSMFKNAWDHYFALFNANIQYRFRDSKQFIPVLFVQYQLFLRGGYYRDRCKKGLMIHSGFHGLKKIKHRLKRAEKDARIFCICFQSMDQGGEDTQAFIFSWLNQRITLPF